MSGPVARAQAALAETVAALEAFGAERDKALIGDDDVRVVELDDEIARQTRKRSMLADKVRLLQAEAEREAIAKQAAEREAQIAGVEALLAERDAAAGELQEHLTLAVKRAFRKIEAVNEAIKAAWPFDPARHYGGAMLNGGALVLAVGSFLYKIGAKPPQTGGAQGNPGVAFPGAKPPKFEFVHQPEALPELVESFRAASRYAGDLMRGVATAAPAPVAESAAVQLGIGRPLAASVDKERLAEIYVRMNALASSDTPESEAEYRALGEELKTLDQGA